MVGDTSEVTATNRTRVFVMRHGESDNVLAGAAGAVPSAALTLAGRDQAMAAAQMLRGEGITRIYSSTAVRARDTARIIAEALAIDTLAMPELVEGGIGVKEGATDPATRSEAADVLHAWVVDQNLDARVADGETGHQVIARMAHALNTIAADHPVQTVALVGHVASLSAALSVLCALDDRVRGTPLPHAIPFLVEWDGRTWHCPTWVTAST
jgi:2,3-bisphosphoglycerate-dependent phosphoglycerate mutase